MEDALIRNRIRDILEQKIAMGMGCHGCYDPRYGYGDGVLVGGARKKKKRAGAFQKAVGAYMRKHGVSLAEASKAISRSGRYGSKTAKRRTSKKRKSTRRKRVSGRGYGYMGYGGAKTIEDLELEAEEAERKKRIADKALVKSKYCAKEPEFKSEAQARRWLMQCDPSYQKKAPSKVKKYALSKLLDAEIDKLLK